MISNLDFSVQAIRCESKVDIFRPTKSGNVPFTRECTLQIRDKQERKSYGIKNPEIQLEKYMKDSNYPRGVDGRLKVQANLGTNGRAKSKST
jgi:hypothetical protein